ncbi:hypothetical protein ACOIWS_006007 [Salmonella enterica]
MTKSTKGPLFAEVHNVPDDYHFTEEELDRIIAGDMFTPRQDAIMARELQQRRKADSAEPAGYHVIKECGKVGCSVATLEEAEKTRDFWNKRWAIRPYFYTPPARDNKQTDELVMWVKRLAHSLRNTRPNSKLHDAAMDYLSRKGLISVEDVLR